MNSGARAGKGAVPHVPAGADHASCCPCTPSPLPPGAAVGATKDKVAAAVGAAQETGAAAVGAAQEMGVATLQAAAEAAPDMGEQAGLLAEPLRAALSSMLAAIVLGLQAKRR